ncbi:MAG: aminotransferase class I/II-fold pyridoxal phosphate-dependent enzyme, partial [Motilibacteraceae bacterium]
GWVPGPPAWVAGGRPATQFLTYVNGAPVQPAVAAGLGLPDEYFAGLRDGLRAKRDRLCDGLASVGFDVFVPQGTYFVTTDIRPLGHEDGLEFCRELAHRAGVVAIPCQVFYDDLSEGRHLVRWAFCKRDGVLDEAVRRLAVLK